METCSINQTGPTPRDQSASAFCAVNKDLCFHTARPWSPPEAPSSWSVSEEYFLTYMGIWTLLQFPSRISNICITFIPSLPILGASHLPGSQAHPFPVTYCSACPMCLLWNPVCWSHLFFWNLPHSIALYSSPLYSLTEYFNLISATPTSFLTHFWGLTAFLVCL